MAIMADPVVIVSVAGLVTTATASVVPAWWAHKRERAQHADAVKVREEARVDAQHASMLVLASEIVELAGELSDTGGERMPQAIRLVALLRRGVMELPNESAELCRKASSDGAYLVEGRLGEFLPAFIASIRRSLYNTEVVERS